jgi:hypothetical protein
MRKANINRISSPIMGDSPPVSIWQNWKQSRKAKITEKYILIKFLLNLRVLY